MKEVKMMEEIKEKVERLWDLSTLNINVSTPRDVRGDILRILRSLRKEAQFFLPFERGDDKEEALKWGFFRLYSPQGEYIGSIPMGYYREDWSIAPVLPLLEEAGFEPLPLEGEVVDRGAYCLPPEDSTHSHNGCYQWRILRILHGHLFLFEVAERGYYGPLTIKRFTSPSYGEVRRFAERFLREVGAIKDAIYEEVE